MILRYDRVGIELPEGSPDATGAMAVQELMGGRFGEMSTLMNYTFQSFNFRGRAELRPFYDLIANIAAEEYGHIEIVALDDQRDADRHRRQGRRGDRQPAPRAQGRQGRAAGRRQRRAVDGRLRLLLRRPRRGPDPQLLPRDRRPQRQAEGLRDGRPPGRAGADRLPARPRRRPPGRLRAGARADHRRRHLQDVPGAADPDREDPRVQAAPRGEVAPHALPLLARGLQGGRRGLQGPAPGDGRGARRRRRGARGLPAARGRAGDRRLRARLRARRHRRDRAEAAQGRGPRSEGADLPRDRGRPRRRRPRPAHRGARRRRSSASRRRACAAPTCTSTRSSARSSDEGDILGHEPMGIVEEVGAGRHRARGRRPRRRSRSTSPAGTAGCAARGCTPSARRPRCTSTAPARRCSATRSSTARCPAGRRSSCACRSATSLPIKVPEGPPDDRFLFLSDVLPTAWQAVEYAGVPDGGTLLVLGLGPIGDMAARIAIHQGRAGDRRRPRARAARARPRRAASRRSTSTSTARTSATSRAS